ncbi:MAG: MarR family transcriptional regulator [Planctomycetia bacterium]|nr:MarR family transcriptional regulator [Planctomycetia bacterium]
MNPHPKKSSACTTSATPRVGPPLIGALLRVPHEIVRRRMLEALHQAGFTDLAAPHLVVLQHPGPDGASPSELAARLRMSKQSLNYLLGELERAGYLERVAGGGDGRSRRVVLTRRGWALVPVLRGAVREVERLWEKKLGRRRLEELRASLREIAEEAPGKATP